MLKLVLVHPANSFMQPSAKCAEEAVVRVKARRYREWWTARAEFRRIPERRPAASDSPPGFVFPNEAEELLNANIALAETRARRSLEVHPNDNYAKYLLGAVLCRKGDWNAAIALLEPLTQSQPHIGGAWSELGLALERLGQTEKAVDALIKGIDANPVNREAWYALGNLVNFGAPVLDVRLQRAASELLARRPDAAQAILREFLQFEPGSARALKLLGDSLVLAGRWQDAKIQFEKCVLLEPHFTEGRLRYATMLVAYREYRAAIPQIEALLKDDPGNILYRYLRAVALGGSRQYETAIAEYERLMEELPDRPGVWMQYAQLVRASQPKNCGDAFDRVLRQFPSLVEAAYLLATIKSFRFDLPWVNRIRAQLENPDLDLELRAQVHFALGKAFEDVRQYADSFKHYEKSNEILLGIREPDIDSAVNFKWLAKKTYTRAFFHARKNVGCHDTGAIFIVGMPRSGSTLLEQILSSHSAVEALGELQVLPDLIRERLGPDPALYPEFLKTLPPEKLRELGQEYVTRTLGLRRLQRPFFTDKLPINYANIPLIHLMLPNAKIVDARRHPLDCGFSCYKHYFPAGQVRALSLSTMGRWYADYVELMAHFDEVLPGKAHRVIYERLVDNPVSEVRRLLDNLGLPFEEQCLRFHETERVVRTISAEQVRMPMYKSGVAHWRHYEKWLGPLRQELGGVLQAYPEVPRFYARVKARAHSFPFGRINDITHMRGARQISFGSGAP